MAVVMLAVFAGGYLVLAGADIGMGMLLPVLGKSQDERRLVIAGIAPFFLGNEVWLVSTAGIVAGAFPGLEHDLLTGLFPLFVVLLTGWVVRDMGLWLRGRVDAAAWRSLCDGLIVAGSWALGLSWGGVLGSILFGGGMNAGSAVGMVLAALFAAHGAGLARWRLTGVLVERARRIPSSYPVTGVALVAVMVAAGARLSLSDAASTGTALSATAVLTAVMLPLLVASQALVWWTFRDRVVSPTYL
ncbi:cytochrome d ubiquinol oxidase subunit II [Actinomadura barringtoniae]|uniref:Cytochrome d ubiquinol oxidase subunit II n=1 Tax=Actinomadura barringtoniae TaxID=1427535 RepID=A0A939TCM9_9ACTN|nr:cytochrome d ubiquinol oxidase subunit II [Actinomadura barringtoniae]